MAVSVSQQAKFAPGGVHSQQNNDGSGSGRSINRLGHSGSSRLDCWYIAAQSAARLNAKAVPQAGHKEHYQAFAQLTQG